MRSANQIDVILLSELSHYLLSESEADATIVVAPVVDIFIRVRPKDIAEKASIRHVRRSHNIIDSQDSVEFR